MISIISDMYTKAKAKVKSNEYWMNILGDPFSIEVGTRQGCNLSPNLFNIFINELPKHIENEACDQVMLGNHKLPCMLFADDIILLSSSKNGLQKALDVVDKYCTKWRLRFNMSKSNIMIFNMTFNRSKSFEF